MKDKTRKRNKSLPCALAALGLIFSGLADSQAGVLLEFKKDGLDAVSILPGQSFTFDVFLSITGSEELTGYDYYLEASGVLYDSFFTIASRVSNPAFFPELNNSDAAVAELPDAVLDPDNGLSLGALVNNPAVPLSGVGQYLLASFTFSTALNAIPGVYTINAVDALWFDQDFEEFPFGLLVPFTVTVVPVPEPSLGMPLAAGLLWLVFFRRKSC